MVLISKKTDADIIINDLKKYKLQSHVIGKVINKKGKPIVNYINI
jgi:hydrogenase maturation factor